MRDKLVYMQSRMLRWRLRSTNFFILFCFKVSWFFINVGILLSESFICQIFKYCLLDSSKKTASYSHIIYRPKLNLTWLSIWSPWLLPKSLWSEHLLEFFIKTKTQITQKNLLIYYFNKYEVVIHTILCNLKQFQINIFTFYYYINHVSCHFGKNPNNLKLLGISTTLLSF